MKNFNLFNLIIIIIISILTSCSKDSITDVDNNETEFSIESNKTSSNSNILEGLDLSKVDFSGCCDGSGTYDNSEEGRALLAKELALYSFSTDISNEEKIKFFRIYFTASTIYVNNSSGGGTPPVFAPCGNPQSSTCMSPSCVEDLLNDILGEERDVDISFDFGAVSVTVTWDFTDC